MFPHTKISVPAAVGLFVSLLTAGPVATAGEGLKALERELQAILKTAEQSVVTVTSEFAKKVANQDKRGNLSFLGSSDDASSVIYLNVGTGIIFDENGIVVTRSSVVVGARSNKVTFATGEETLAEYVGQDPHTGFAVLRIAKEATPVSLGDSDELYPGSLTFMIGNSYGAYPSVVFGSINSIREDGMLQLSTHLNPGNNGSPIINMAGEVVGLIAGKLNAPNGYYGGFSAGDLSATTLAYPSKKLQQIVARIIKFGEVKKGWLGVVGFDNSAKPQIREIKDNSPAQQAGLVSGDVILSFSSTSITSVEQLARLVESTQPGETVPMEYLRDQQRLRTQVRLGEKMQVKIRGGNVRNQRAAVTNSKTPAEQALNEATLIERIEQLQAEVAKLRELIKQ